MSKSARQKSVLSVQSVGDKNYNLLQLVKFVGEKTSRSDKKSV